MANINIVIQIAGRARDYGAHQGAFAAIVQAVSGSTVLKSKQLVGGCEKVTSHIMGMSAAMAALSSLKSTGYPVVIQTSDRYIMNGLKFWVPTWKENGWVTKEGNAVKCKELWETLYDLYVSTGAEIKFGGNDAAFELCKETLAKIEAEKKQAVQAELEEAKAELEKVEIF